MTDDIQKCIEVLKRGGLILYPTDTIWGIGCDATNEDAVRRVFRLKQRDDSCCHSLDLYLLVFDCYDKRDVSDRILSCELLLLLYIYNCIIESKSLALILELWFEHLALTAPGSSEIACFFHEIIFQ